MSVVKVHVSTSKTFSIRHEDDAVAKSFCAKAHNIAKRHKGIVIEEKKVSDGEYLFVVYFSKTDSMKVWQNEVRKSNVAIEDIVTSRTYIIKDRDQNDNAAVSFCSQAKNTASHYTGFVVAEKQLMKGAYLLVVYFSDEGLMNVWETSAGIA